MTRLALALALPLLLACGGPAAAPPSSDPLPREEAAGYDAQRERFLGDMRAVHAEQAEASRSVAGRVKRVVSFGGLAVGLGGTLASLVVEDEDTRATIGQASGALASISGIVGLLPFGNPPPGAAAIGRYLDMAIPRFEERWPEGAGPLDVQAAGAFAQDMEDMRATVRSLAR